MSYEKLFSKGKINQLTLKNRIVMAAMGTSLSSFTGEATDEAIRYYEERAKGGCGLIITEIVRINDIHGIGEPGQMSATSTKYVRKLTQLVDAVHQYDTKIFMQLHHAGREVSSRLLNGLQPVAPSPIACKVIQEVPRELTTEECDELVRQFVTGAAIAQLSGFDGVELHGAHGYLINQFLSPYTNKRTDKYGGDFDKRLTFLSSIIQGVRATCGPRFPISVRISADEFVEGGLTLTDSVKIAKALEALGVDALNVSAGTYESGYAVIEPQFLPEGWKKHLATEIKKSVQIPVIAVNNIKYPATAERFLQEGVSDFVAFGRSFLTDAAWPQKAKAGEEIFIHKCIGCLHCFKTINRGFPVECTVNPTLGRELRYRKETLQKDGQGRTMVVIGAGPGGMHAAYILAQRGYHVTLLEKSNSLGGTLKTAEQPPAKEMIGEFIKTMQAELESVGVEVRYNCAADVETVQKLNPYGVVVACGGTPIVPKVRGVELPHVVTAEDVLLKKVAVQGSHIAVIGGGVTGLETAEVVAKHGAVTVVEMQPAVGKALYASNRAMLLRRLAEAKVDIKTNAMLTEIQPNQIVLKQTETGEETTVPCDTVILALGVVPQRQLVESMEAAFDKVMVVGDANKPGQIVDALKEANDKAYVF